MRFSLLFATLLLPHLLLAQLAPPKISGAGYYTLPTTGKVFTNGLSFVPYETAVVVKDSPDKKVKFTPSQVSSFTIGKRKFVAINNIVLKEKYRGIPQSLFAEQLDSGQLVLHKLHLMSYGGYGGMAGSSSPNSLAILYLLRASSESDYTLIPADKMGGKKDIQEKLSSYFTARPDLINVLQTKGPTSVITDNLPAIVQAFNTEKPYSLPLTHYDQVKQLMAEKKAQKAKQATLAADSTTH